MLLKLPITNRIINKTIKSKFFIIFTALVTVIVIVANICLSVLPPKNYITNSLMTQFCINYALVGLFICGFQMWYVWNFHNADFKLGVFALEIRSGISRKKLICERIILNIVLSSTILLIFNLIVLTTMSFAQAWILQAMSVSIFIGMFLVFLINIFVYFCLLAFTSFKNSLIIGIMGTLIFILSAMNFIFAVITTMQSKYYNTGFGENNATYKTLASTVKLEKNPEYESKLNQLYQDFYELESFFQGSVAETLMTSGMILYAYLEQLEATGTKNSNQFIELLDELNQGFTKNYASNTSMWSNSFFDTSSSQSYTLVGTYNFNELINWTSKSQDGFIKELSQVVQQNFLYSISLKTYVEGYDLNKQFAYGETSANWMQKYGAYNLTPGLRIYTIALAYLISNRINVPYFSNDQNKNVIQTYNKAVLKHNYFNPFIGLQATMLYPYLADKDISSLITAKNDMWFFGMPQVYAVKYTETDSGMRDFFKNPSESNFLEISAGQTNFNPIVIFLEYFSFIVVLALIYWWFSKRNLFV